MNARARENPSAGDQRKPNGSEQEPKRDSIRVMLTYQGSGSVSAGYAIERRRITRSKNKAVGLSVVVGRARATGSEQVTNDCRRIRPARASTSLAFAPWPMSEDTFGLISKSTPANCTATHTSLHPTRPLPIR